MSLRVLGQQFSRGVKMGVFADAGKNIHNFAAVWFGVLNSIGGQKGKTEMMGEINQRVVRLFFSTNEVALEFYEDVFMPKGVDQ